MDEGNVLIVDDNPNNLTLLGGVLQTAGYRVRGAADGLQALKIAVARAPELILLDLQMPGIDGYETCRRLKADPATRDIPVIFISALDDVGGKVRAFEAGGVDYVTKPFQAPEVLSRVGTHLQLARLRRRLEEKQADLAAQNAALERKNEELVQAQRRTERVFSALAAALPGTVLDEKYRLDEKIGTGGFGTVFKAEHLAMKRPVAVKVFRPWDGGESPVALERFRREGVATSRLDHANAVKILDCGIASSGIAYIVMELLRGVSLAELLGREGALSLARAAGIARSVCEALASAHAIGLVHRDIKPDNIFLHAGGQGEVVKVLDFGIAKMLGDGEAEAPQATLTRGIVGTPAYVAPERLKSEAYDGQADIYSVGVMLYQMLAGRLPFEIPREQAFVAAYRTIEQDPPPLAESGAPAAFQALVMRALAKDPGRRPSATELAAALKSFA